MRRPWLWLFALVLPAAVGCGPTFIKVKGQVLKDGLPLQPGRGQMIRVCFVPADGGETALDTFPANQGSERHIFIVPGKNGKGIPPGKYRIAVLLSDSSGDKDFLKGAFSLEKSPIIRDIRSSDELIIDLAKPAG